jgi:uncharacterized protein (TIGR03435 family)
MVITHRVALAVLFASQTFAQTPHVEFEAAATQPFVPNAQDRSAGGVHIDGSQVRASGFSLRDLAGIAYGIKATLISGPDWTASERYEISAASPAGARQDQLREMFQSDRFLMKVHRIRKSSRFTPWYSALKTPTDN